MSNKHKTTSKNNSTDSNVDVCNQGAENSESTPAFELQCEKERHERIATAAYFLAEKRGFNEGNEIQDWLDAEVEAGS
jgi:hypothetical protein